MIRRDYANTSEDGTDGAGFADRVARLCLEKFDQLPGKGKPISGKEWTLLSGVVRSDGSLEALEVVAVATGTKCIGRSKLCGKGLVVNDSHAEVRPFKNSIEHHSCKVPEQEYFERWYSNKLVFVIEYY